VNRDLTVVLSRKPFGIGHMYIYTFLLRMTDTVTSQNTDLSSWTRRKVAHTKGGHGSDGVGMDLLMGAVQ
jgi:hypothetical protein